MGDEMRRSGIDIIGDIPWGTHLCQFYKTKADLIDILVPYFKAGLEDNEFCMWVTSKPLEVQDAEVALRKAVSSLDKYLDRGQIELIDYTQEYTKSGGFDSDEVLQGWVNKHDQAIGKGFDGLRLTGNTFWLAGEAWKSFADYEAVVDNIIGKYRMIAICSYALDRCGASEIIDVVNRHRFALIRREGKWELMESSRRKRVEEALRESEMRYRQLFQSIGDAVMVLGAKGRFVDCNEATLQRLGYSREEFLRLGAADVVHADFLPLMQENQKRLWAGETTVVESAHRCKDGRVIPVEATASRIEYQGEPAILAVVRDITERKRMEQQLKEYSDNLEQLVEARTRELKDAQDKLIRAERLTALGKLASSVAHELRQPLSVINNSVYFLKKQLPDAGEKVSRHLDILQQEAVASERIISDLLGLARPKQPRLAEVELNGIIQQALSRAQLPPNVEATLSLGELPPLMADAEQLGRVFLNLILNAAQAMPDGGRLVVSSGAEDNLIQVEVQDSGVGIPKEKLSRIFEPMFSTKANGTGLGLSICKSIVEAHQGNIQVQSQPGEGTVVTVTLPLRAEEGRNG